MSADLAQDIASPLCPPATGETLLDVSSCADVAPIGGGGRVGAPRTTTTDQRSCNCRDNTNCPLDGKCLESSLVYEATLTTEQDSSKYIGLTEGTFKTRYNGHQQSFNHEKYRHSTELSKKAWSLKDVNKEFKISWAVRKKAHAFSGGPGECDLCLTEKLFILTDTSKNFLNTRKELVSKCRHKNKHLLRKCQSNFIGSV